jgi:hypothetical protein
MVGIRGVVRAVRVPAVALMLVAVQACMVLIPVVIIHYLRSSSGYTAQAQIPVAAEKVYATALTLAQEKDFQIVSKDDQDLKVKVTDGKQEASLKAVRIDAGTCAVTVTANVRDAKDKKAESEELALRVFERLCERLKVSYKITKK